MYNKHFFTAERVGTLEYAVSMVVAQTEARIGKTSLVSKIKVATCLSYWSNVEFVPKQFTAVLSFPAPDVVGQFNMIIIITLTNPFIG